MSGEMDPKLKRETAEHFSKVFESAESDPHAPPVYGTYDVNGDRTVLAEAVKAFGELDVDRVRREFEMVVVPLQEVVLLVNPLEHESVIDAVIESSLIPAGEIRLAPSPVALVRVGKVTL